MYLTTVIDGSCRNFSEPQADTCGATLSRFSFSLSATQADIQIMNPSTLIGIAASLMMLASVLLLSAQAPSSFINLPGLAIVLTGTLAATFISYPLREVVRVVRLVGLVFRRENSRVEEDLQELVGLAKLWFSGDVRGVEKRLDSLRNPFHAHRYSIGYRQYPGRRNH